MATIETTKCKPPPCKPLCHPVCSSQQSCVLKTMVICGQCPESQCVDLSYLGIPSMSSTSSASSASTPPERVGLIAGLTTGLVAMTLMVITLVGFVYYRRRQTPHTSSNQHLSCLRPELSLLPTVATPLPVEHCPQVLSMVRPIQCC
ncbi:hypothetical protein BDF14DRAFT_1151624 [Spinellus fusiger]|nr:hypothetical protein BDF14DRAFT_1151624 [Spinellus fusiger]